MLCAKYGFGPSEDFAAQTSDPHAIFWGHATKPRPSTATNPRSIAHAKQLGHPRQRSHDQSRTQSSSAICVNEATIDRARKAARPSAAKEPRSIAHAKQLGHQLQRTHVAADGRAALRARSIVGLLPWLAELLCVRDPR